MPAEHAAHERPEAIPSASAVSPDIRIKVPTYSEIREKLGNVIVSNIWHDGGVDPKREAFRPDFAKLNGVGATLNMPLAASWMSSGPSAEKEKTNIVVFPKKVDRTFTQYMQQQSILGDHVFGDFSDLPQVAGDKGMPIYSVDDLPVEWDSIAKNNAKLMRVVNTKKYLSQLSSFAAPYELVNLKTTTEEDFLRFGGGRIYIKKNNSENTGNGVIICDTVDDYLRIVQELKTEAEREGLDNEIVLQGKVDGINSSFQYFTTPDRPNDLDVITVSKQFVGPDGKTYAGSENPPLSLEDVEPDVAALIIDMHERIRALDPTTFGFVMCDFFRTKDGLLAFDPGLRPTGNTATTLARMHVEEATNTPGYWSGLFFVPSQKPGTSFKEYIEPIDGLMGTDAALRDGNAALPWGYNQYQGNGLFIAVSRTREGVQAVMDECKRVLVS